MNVTEQLDALRVMGSDPIAIWSCRDFLACVLLTPMLTIYSDVLGIIGGWFIAVKTFDIPNETFWEYTSDGVEHWQIMEGLVNSVLLRRSDRPDQLLQGFHCGSGASGVGRACTESFVAMLYRHHHAELRLRPGGSTDLVRCASTATSSVFGMSQSTLSY